MEDLGREREEGIEEEITIYTLSSPRSVVRHSIVHKVLLDYLLYCDKTSRTVSMAALPLSLPPARWWSLHFHVYPSSPGYRT